MSNADLRDDVAFCAQLDIHGIVPMMDHDGRISLT